MVQMHGVPLEKINCYIAKKIGNEIGVVTDVEEPIRDQVLARTFLRERVAMNVYKPLPTGIWLNRVNQLKILLIGQLFILSVPGVESHKEISDKISEALVGMDPTLQSQIDQAMIDLDKTEKKAELGANAILPVSIAACKAGAAEKE
ncbi:hypothetical protein PIB30_109280, partial [Stylosanthes scabra]|nr:hypothetical protein [Stylosanthes scabra]